jgi:hypothetical protein
MNRLALAALLLASACSKKPAQNYRSCLKLRVGMTREQVFAAMGPAEETFPYVEGKSLPHLKGKTAYEWTTPASMPAPNRVTVDEKTGLVETIRCGDSQVTTAVFVEPPAPVVTPAPELNMSTSAVQAPAPRPRSKPREATNGQGAAGKPLTE